MDGQSSGHLVPSHLGLACGLLVKTNAFLMLVMILQTLHFEHPKGQRTVTQVPIGFCTKYGVLHHEIRIFLKFSWVDPCYVSFCRLFQCLFQNNSDMSLPKRKGGLHGNILNFGKRHFSN